MENKTNMIPEKELVDVSGGLVVRSVSVGGSVDFDQSGCAGYSCKSCGATRGAHTASCTVARPDCCGSCANTVKHRNELICINAISVE